MEMSRKYGTGMKQIPDKFSNIMKWGLRGVMVLTFPFIAKFEASFSEFLFSIF